MIPFCDLFTTETATLISQLHRHENVNLYISFVSDLQLIT